MENALQKYLRSIIWKSQNELRTLMKALKIRCYFEDGLILFKYEIDANFKDSIVKNARGIILYEDTLEIACYPFDKFGDYDEKYSDKIDWTTAKCQEKIDGSIIKLWFDKRKTIWRLSSDLKIDASEALTAYGITLEEIFHQCDGDIDYTKLSFDKTYIFELVSPYNRVVINYDKPKLWHIGTRDNITQLECDDYIGVYKPVTYPINSLEYAKQFVINVNKESFGHEGLVVVDAEYHRVKIKSDIWKDLHYVETMQSICKERCVKILLSNRQDVVEYSPKTRHILGFYKYQLDEMQYNVDLFIKLCRKLYTDLNGDKTAFGKRVSKFKYAPFGFRSINNPRETASDMIGNLRPKQICEYIDSYKNTNKIEYRDMFN